MNRVAVSLAKLAGLQKAVCTILKNDQTQIYFDPSTVLEYFDAYNRTTVALTEDLPDLFGDLPDRPIPNPSGGEFQGRGYIDRLYLERVVRDVDYIFEIRSHSEYSYHGNAN